MAAPQKRKHKRQQVERLREEGYGIRRIARLLGLSRNTVREILDPARRERRREKRRPTRETTFEGSLLDPYKKHLDEILEEDERHRQRVRSAKPLTTTFLLKEIRKLGYQGGRTILDDYLRTLRGPRRRARRAFRRFETSPAEESQQDWTSYKLEVGGKLCSVQVFSLILCWSRQQFLRAYLDQRQSTLFWAHVAAFHYFEGVPWKIVYDRQRTISPFEIDGKPVLHEKFRAFAEHYGFDVFICEGGDKERKGKIERPFLYLETSFLPRRRFESLEDLNRQLRNWLDGVEFPEEGNRRIHETTNEVPHERWLEEKEYLLELPQTDFLPRRIEERQVAKDATVSVGNTRYSVPARLVEKGVRKVWVSVGEEDLLVQDPRGEIVARHRIDRHRKLVIDDEHYKEIRRLKRGTHHVSELERKFLELFPQRKGFLEGAKKTLRSIAPIHLREILALVRRYRREDVDTALECALSHGTTTAGYVREILERKRPTGHLARIETETPRGLALGPVDPGSAEGYEAIFEFEKESEEEKDKEDDR